MNPWELTSKERIALVSRWVRASLETEPPRDKDAIDLVDMVQEAAQKKLVEWIDREKLHKGIGHIGIEVGRWPDNKPEFNPDCSHCKWQALCETLGVK